jgi:predicted dehydrogenase
MEKVRFGIVGLGNMGSHHAAYMNSVEGATLGAVCDIDAELLARISTKHNVPGFKTYRELLDSGTVDAVLIAVPHYDHMPMAIDAFAKGVHVLCEKPMAVSVKAGREGIAAYAKHPNLKFGIMFNQRSNTLYKKMRQVIADGELGEIQRITWIITNWFRTWAYYASGGWRATWLGEGGGVLINQCPHNLDLIQWITGMLPKRVTAVGAIGRYHPIEVEDDISAILEYENGAMGHFITTTGEAPGTNRLEVVGDRGKIIAEDGKLRFFRTRKSVRDVRETSKESFASVETWPIDIPFQGGSDAHKIITQDFVNVVLNNRPNESLLAPGPDGIRGLELGNAIMMSGLTGKAVEIPVDGDAYDAFIKDMAKKHGGRKKLTTQAATADMAASFGK